MSKRCQNLSLGSDESFNYSYSVACDNQLLSQKSSKKFESLLPQVNNGLLLCPNEKVNRSMISSVQGESYENEPVNSSFPLFLSEHEDVYRGYITTKIGDLRR